SLRAKPPPRHPLPLAVHADVQIRIAPYCLHLPRDTGCASTSSLHSRRRETAICTSTILASLGVMSCRLLRLARLLRRSAKPKFHVINSSSFRTRSSTSVLLRVESILSLESYCKLAPTRMHSTFDQEDFLDGFRTPHHSAFFHSAAPDRSLDIGCRRWRDQHRIPRRQLARRLLFPFQGCQGRLARRDSSDASQRNYYGRTGTRPVPWPRAAHRAAR